MVRERGSASGNSWTCLTRNALIEGFLLKVCQKLWFVCSMLKGLGSRLGHREFNNKKHIVQIHLGEKGATACSLLGGRVGVKLWVVHVATREPGKMKPQPILFWFHPCFAFGQAHFWLIFGEAKVLRTTGGLKLDNSSKFEGRFNVVGAHCALKAYGLVPQRLSANVSRSEYWPHWQLT